MIELLAYLSADQVGPILGAMIASFLMDASGGMSMKEILPWVTTFSVTVIGAVLVPVLKNKWQEDKKREMQIGPQPFEIKMQAEYVTRREFEKLEQNMILNISEIKGSVTSSTTEMRVLFAQTMAAMKEQQTALTGKIERQNKSLGDEIGRVASGAYTGRQKIWEQVNDQREALAAMKATSNVAHEIGKLADAIAKPAQTPNPSKA
jgi:hypothetical protein